GFRARKALAGIRYDRAFPAIDRVLRHRQSDKQLLQLDNASSITDSIHQQVDTVAWRAYRSAPTRSRVASVGLLSVLERLLYAPPDLIDSLRQDTTSIVTVKSTAGCDRNGDR